MTAALAVSLAKPIAQGFLSWEGALAAIALANDRAMSSGTARGSGALAERIEIDMHLLRRHVQTHRARRETVTGSIRRRIRPLLETGANSGRLLAEAHDVNGGAGFPLTEEEVTQHVATEVHWFLRRRKMHGRR